MGFAIKRGDTRVWTVQLKEGSTGGGVDLTNASVIRCYVYEQGSTVQVIDSTCAYPTSTEYPSTDGWVEVAPTSSEVGSTGHFDAEWEIAWSDGTYATFPGDSMEELIIARDLKRN